MDKHLNLLAASYDKGIEYGSKGINLYDNLPDHIKAHKDYPKWDELMKNGHVPDSKRHEVKSFLDPKSNMKLVDLGCCLNLMFNDYDKWQSIYYGIDISPKTIELLEKTVEERGLVIGSLDCGSVHDTPYDNAFFDFATCIGILEYFEDSFVEQAIEEASRILKNKGKMVLDIPDQTSPIYSIIQLIEAHIGRPDKFNMSVESFELLLSKYFTIHDKTNEVGMIQYYLVKK